MKVNEWAGKGNHTTAKFWDYDTRTGRRLNLDPEEKKYPGLSPYATNNDNPIRYSDPLGDDPKSRKKAGEAGLSAAGMVVTIGGGPVDPVTDVVAGVIVVGVSAYIVIDWIAEAIRCRYK